jgi:O-antigen/teichoic acid export membrane protein
MAQLPGADKAPQLNSRRATAATMVERRCAIALAGSPANSDSEAMPRWTALLSHRIVTGTLAGYYGQFIQLGVQLISLPVFTAHWGLAGYGTWLILFTIPSSLALADLGLSSVGGNTMTAAAARGEIDRARAIYASLRLIALATGAVVVGAVGFVLIVVRPHSLDFAQVATGGRAVETACLLLGYGFLSLTDAAPVAVSRAVDAYASTTGIFQTVVLVEAIAALATAMLGHGPTAVAWAYFLVRLAGTLVLNIYVISRASWLRNVPWRLDRAELRELFAPAMAALVLPGANALTVQGAVVVIGAIGGPAAVPAFTAVRTLSRTALQFAFRLNFASMPRYTVLAATDDRAGMDRLVLLNLVFTAMLVLPAAVAILVLGRPIIAIWTHGLVHPSFLLLAMMVATMLLNAAWVPIGNLIMSINRHAGFSYYFLLASVLSVGTGALLQQRIGTIGMVGALVLQDAAMASCVWRLGFRTGVIPRGVLAASWRYFGELARQLQPSR